ncbi:MAG: glycosyltransferase [Ideonella sp.]|nr:glycosyltransferase [Ideonella sp.]
MAKKKSDIGRLVKDPDLLQDFLENALHGEVARRIVMIVGNRIVGDSRVLKSAASLAEQGFEIVLIGARALPDDYSCGFVEGIPFVLVNSEELSPAADADGHVEAMQTIGERVCRALASATFSLLYTHDFWGLDIGLSVMQAYACRQPLYWVHDVHEYVKGYEGILPAGRLQYAIDAEARHLGLPDQLVFVNERIGGLLSEQFDLDRSRSLVVHNAPRQQVASDFQLRQRIGLAADVPLGVYLGRATKARGLDVLIPALAEIPTLHFALLSSAVADYLTELRELAVRSGVADRLHVFGYVPDAEVASAAASATFGISPLTRYGNSDLAVPTKVLEFIHAELPMVVSDATFQADFVRQHGLGEVFVSNDADGFVAAVRKVIAGGHAPDWQGLREQYSWGRQFGQVVDAIEAQAASPRVASRGVFQGPAPSAGQPGILARALRKAGAPAQSINVAASRGFQFRSDAYWPAPTVLSQASLAMWAARRFDVFHLHYRPIMNVYQGDRYEPAAFQDLSLMRQAGKRILFQFRGSEIRVNARFGAMNPFAWDEAADPSGMSDALKERLLETVRQNADLILVPDPELQTYVPEARILQRAVELDRLPYVGARRRERPRVCHAPTRRAAKGTDMITEAVAALHKEGLEFDFVLLEGLPHYELIAQLAEADVVIDQILIGWYGVLSVEAMALGKAVIAFIRDDLVHEVPPGVLVNANPKSIARQLRGLVTDADRRVELGRAARHYVETYHAAGVVAEKLRSLYQEVAQMPRRDASMRLFADGLDSALRLMALNKQAAAAKAAAKQASMAEGAKAPEAHPAAETAKKPRKPRPPRTILQRLAHASPAKVINRIQRILGRP